MSYFRRHLSRLAALIRRRHDDADLTEELETHLSLLEADLQRQGLTADEARRLARQRLGGLVQTVGAAREARMNAFLDQFRQEVTWAWRALCAGPAFTLTTLLTLALAIGGTMSVFTIANAVLVRPLPYPASEQIVALSGTEPVNVSGEMFHALRERLGPDLTLAAMGGSMAVNLRNGTHAAHVTMGRVSREYFDVVAIQPRFGRAFTGDEDSAGGAAAVVIADELWRTELGGRPDAVGTTLYLDGKPHTVVGIMPPEFRSFPGARLWGPLQLSPQDQGLNYLLLTRLPPAVPIGEARARLAVVSAQVRDMLSHPGPFAGALTWKRYRDVLGHDGRDDLLVLQVAAFCALLLACVNVAGLQLARAAAREPEWATRAAIGGGPARLVRQTVVEALLLAGMGTVAGLVITWFAVPVVVGLLPPSITAGREVAQDVRVYGAAAMLLFVVAAGVGVVPARAARRVDLRTAMGIGRRQTADRRTGRWRQVLVVGQLACALVLVVAALLLLRTLASYHRVDLGFEPSRLVAGAMSLQGASESTTASPPDFVEQTLDEIRRLPGVSEATAASSLPVDRALNLPIDPPPSSRISEPRSVDWQYVGSRHRHTLGTTLRKGRDFDSSDTAAGNPVAIVNEAFVRMYFASESPIGRQIRLAIPDMDPERTIIGVIADVRASSGTDWARGRNALDAPAAPGIYVPLAQVRPELLSLVHRFARVQWLVRADADTVPVVRQVADLIRGREPSLPPIEFVPLTTVIGRELAMERTLLWLMGGLGAGALLLAALGAYGLLAATVQARTQEIAIRLALGATRRDVMRAVTAEGARLVAVALLLGIPAAVLAARLIRAYLRGVGLFDVPALTGAAALLIAAGAVAVLMPSVRAARIAPARVLRS